MTSCSTSDSTIANAASPTDATTREKICTTGLTFSTAKLHYHHTQIQTQIQGKAISLVQTFYHLHRPPHKLSNAAALAVRSFKAQCTYKEMFLTSNSNVCLANCSAAWASRRHHTAAQHTWRARPQSSAPSGNAPNHTTSTCALIHSAVCS